MPQYTCAKPLAKIIMPKHHKLKSELLSMAEEDQRVLQELSDHGELGGAEYHPRMKALHQKNNAHIREIITRHGWPGISLVGKEGSEAAWLVVQHAILDVGLMEDGLTLLKAATAQGEAEGWCVAYLEDRLLTMSGKPQIYGTQHAIDENGSAYPLSIENPAKVESLRKELGLEPLSEATQRIQERYDTATANRAKNG